MDTAGRKFRVVLFDWEGVMTPIPKQSFDYVLQGILAFGSNEADIRAAMSPLLGQFLRGKINNTQFWQALESQLDITVPHSFQNDVWKNWSGVHPLPEMVDFVCKVKAAGLRVVVFSNVIEPGAQHIRAAGGYNCFDDAVLSCEVSAAKPEERIYHEALKAANCTAENCVFIDDKPRNLEPAKKLGMRTVHATSPAQIRHDLETILGL